MRRIVKQIAGGAAALALIAGGSGYGWYWLETGRYVESTNDAYVKADYTTVAPKVSGYIAAVMVEDNQPVKAGQVLAQIDDRDFKTALAQAQADVANAEAGIRNLDAQLALQQSVIDQANADIASAEAALDFAQQDYTRYRDLLKSGYGTTQRAQQADAGLRGQKAQLQHNHAVLVAAQQQIEVLRTQRAQAETQVQRDRAVEQQAQLNVSYTTIVSPIDGTVGARSLRVGQYVQAGTQLMAVVPLQAVYVVANFKETQLTHVRGGEPVAVSVDTFPGAEFRGHVDSLSPASGLEFSLLPPDNATGNFTKIVQRIPVKIVLERGDPLVGLLRAGMSVEATIDTKATVLAENTGSSGVISVAVASQTDQR
jgi:membrane fusion protein (multidrug efflux system)